MNLKLRPIEDLAEALFLAPTLEEATLESTLAFRTEPPPAGALARLFDERFDEPATLVLVAEAAGRDRPVAACVTGPLVDPLTAEVLPVILVLSVERDLRQRGIARALVREAARLLAARGLTTLGARAEHQNDAVISMGERWGFVRAWELMVLD